MTTLYGHASDKLKLFKSTQVVVEKLETCLQTASSDRDKNGKRCSSPLMVDKPVHKCILLVLSQLSLFSAGV